MLDTLYVSLYLTMKNTLSIADFAIVAKDGLFFT